MSEGTTGPLGPVIPERLGTERLRLILFSPDDVADMRAGRRQDRWHPDYPRQDDVDAAQMLREPGPWGPRHVVVGPLAVGSIGFFGPPQDADTGAPEVEVGYGLVEDARRQGIATEALRCVLSATDAAGVRVRARTEPTNRASVRVLAKTGFTELRGSDDEGMLVMARPLPGGPR
ncbi:MAG: GCN5-related N-acetyltransferase [Nocardioides sp.]|nr:GCN5-related N-acetyltransferase [Nocardioides sp.]